MGKFGILTKMSANREQNFGNRPLYRDFRLLFWIAS